MDPDHDSRTPCDPVGWQGVDFGHQKWISDLGSPRPLSSSEWVVENRRDQGFIHRQSTQKGAASGLQEGSSPYAILSVAAWLLPRNVPVSFFAVFVAAAAAEVVFELSP